MSWIIGCKQCASEIGLALIDMNIRDVNSIITVLGTVVELKKPAYGVLIWYIVRVCCPNFVRCYVSGNFENCSSFSFVFGAAVRKMAEAPSAAFLLPFDPQPLDHQTIDSRFRAIALQYHLFYINLEEVHRHIHEHLLCSGLNDGTVA